MNYITRRNFFKKAGLLAGVALVAPKVLYEIVPCDPRIVDTPYISGVVQFGEVDQLAVKRWAKALQEETEKQTYLHNSVSKKGHIIQLK